MPLYCTDFESDPFAEGWRAAADGTWQWGSPGGSREFGDPSAAYSGSRVVGTGLAATAGGYPERTVTWIESPMIETGQWSDVRLHYRRWLTVQDGYFDQARILVNGEQAWANLSSQGNNNNTQHHEDRAWMFNDVSLSTRIFQKKVQLRWELDSNGSFELGGWTLDDVCIVANTNSVCGDGVKSYYEQCDDGAGNADVADTCRTTCRIAACGDGIQDALEACDDGNDDDTDDCDSACHVVVPPEAPEDPGGCCSAGGSPRDAAAPLGLALFGLFAVTRRRRSTRRAPAR
jgi:MYXO-CTERM domain-containing protein